MDPIPEKVRMAVDTHLPPGSSARKVAKIASLVLIIEGLSVIFLFSYVGLSLGLASLLLGSLLFLTLRDSRDAAISEADTPGMKLVDYVFRKIGGEYSMMLMGAAIVVAVFLFNRYVSQSPTIGDSDTLAILFGLTVMLYPLATVKYRVEATFALMFVGLVVVMLVLPQAIMSISGQDSESSVGNWYVHYMLAAPFANILDLIGVPSSSSGNLVTIQFQDGSINTLTISAYCAGLYSFSIFLSAFVAFVLVFESLQRRVLALVLAVGLVAAYVGNLLRMVVIGVVGYFEGMEALHWTHENAGWMIFLAWSSVFWWLALNYVPVRDKEPETTSSEAN